MLSERVQEIAKQIGQFYLKKHSGDYAAAEKEIRSLDIQRIVDTTTLVVVELTRPGILIGLKGSNIIALEDFLGKKIHIIEAMDSLLNHLIPYPEPSDEELAYEECMEQMYLDDQRERYSDYDDDERNYA
jgi:hypothetical protein